MTSQSKAEPSEDISQLLISVTSDELKNIFDDKDVVSLEYPADEFPTHQTRIMMTFSEQSGKKSQYIELQEWLDLLENFIQSKQEEEEEQEEQSVPNMPFMDNFQHEEHGESFVCIVSFKVDEDEDNVNQIVVEPEERNDCVNNLLETYPHSHLDLTIKFMCKKCFQEQLLEQIEEEFDYYGGSRMIH
ncbi:MAG: hypothetical protein KAI83_05600 [Thiomargarita sp.]|nr:hypothetical protein [Thiomargarita sp.]